MAWVRHDFECKKCKHVFDELYIRSERKKVECPECGSKSLKQLISAPGIASFSMMSPEQKRDHLKKRSADHTQKLIDKEPEKWGQEGIARRSKKIQG